MEQTHLQPVEIRRLSPVEVLVLWNDGHESRFGSELLRKQCPCADCEVQRSSTSKNKLRILANPTIDPVSIQQISMVGTYAIHFAFSDGHTTGIYPYDHLRQICPCSQCAES
jgi:DUF971 family protein